MGMNTYSLIPQASYNQYYTAHPELDKQTAWAAQQAPSSLPPSRISSRQAEPLNAPEEDVVALFADVGPETQELAVHPMQDGLEVLTFPGVLAVK